MKKPTEAEAYKILQQLGISYQRVDHEPIFSVKRYDAVLPGPQVKNLLLKTKKGKAFYLVILPDEKSADLKQLAAGLNCSRLSFATPAELDDLLGLQPGTVTPLALAHDSNHRIQVVIDSSIDRNDTVGFHPNINTTTLILSFKDFERFLDWAAHPPLYSAL
ncbi:prolyl-tRNA synthetase associated domain-containing protein [Bacillus testis]|uniref:prolyl-tRNA synthetase associated domain-containing protein n=1 Tax=Bacillus testis TaxID=1622072 RepID=UPI00067E69D6|nr:prolyl-tRNA synthetase associated domain-containing protein [Bacillus testis]